MNHQAISIFFIVMIISYTLPRYNSYLPTIPIYPDSRKEANVVKQAIKNRTMEERTLFKLTDPSVSHAFANYVDESIEELDRIITKPHVIFPIYCFKYLLNRPRPFQMDPMIRALPSQTAHTPAFPSGHSYQAHYLAKLLSKRYPHKRQILNNLAYQCSYARIAAGLHYPSDNAFSKRLVDILYPSLQS